MVVPPSFAKLRLRDWIEMSNNLRRGSHEQDGLSPLRNPTCAPTAPPDCYSGVAATAGDKRGYSAYDNAPAALDISRCGSRHHQDSADSCVDMLQRRDGDRGRGPVSGAGHRHGPG